MSTVQGATFQVSWPARSKAIEPGLSSAQSAKMVLTAATASGADVSLTIARNATPGAYTQTYTVPGSIKRGAGTFTMSFYVANDGTGAVVGTASGSYTATDGSLGVGVLTVVGTIKSVAVVNPGSIAAGSSAVQLLAQAKDATGATVAVSAGSLHWSIVGDATAASITDDGVLTPSSVGSANVQVTVDGVSANDIITISAAPVAGASFSIVWPERTRAALDHGLNSAQSATVVLAAAASDGSDITVKVNRDASQLGRHTETYPVGQSMRPNATTMSTSLYAQPNQAGAVVGTASGQVSLNGTTVDFASVVVSGTVKSLAVTAAGPFTVGAAAAQLQASAQDASGAIVAISAGSLHWTVTSGTGFLSVTPDGLATPLAAGTAGVQASVDGITSPVANVVVSPTPPNATTLNVEANDLAYDPVNGKIWAIVPNNAAAYADQLVGIDPATGSVTNTVSLGVEASHLAVTDDGQFAYVTVDGDNTVRRIDLAAGAVVATYTVNEGRPYTDLVAVPGQPHSFVVAIDPTQGVNVSVWDDGVRRSGTGAGGSTLHFANDGVTIYGDGSGSLFTDVISPGLITWTNQTTLSEAGFDYSKTDGLIYAANGYVFNPVTKGLVAQLSTADVLFDKGVRVGDADGRIYFVTWDNQSGKRILTFDRSSKAELAPFETGIVTGGAQDLVACGNHTVAFHLFGIGVAKKVVLVRNLP